MIKRELYDKLQFLLNQFRRLDSYLKFYDIFYSIDISKKLKNVLSQIVILDTLYKYTDKFGITRFASELHEIELSLKWLYLYFDFEWEPQKYKTKQQEEEK